MKIKILSVKEIGDTLRVKVESKYGIDSIGMSLNKKYINPFTNKPYWMTEVKEQLKKKYKFNKQGIIEKKEINKELKNKKFELNELDK